MVADGGKKKKRVRRRLGEFQRKLNTEREVSWWVSQVVRLFPATSLGAMTSQLISLFEPLLLLQPLLCYRRGWAATGWSLELESRGSCFNVVINSEGVKRDAGFTLIAEAFIFFSWVIKFFYYLSLHSVKGLQASCSCLYWEKKASLVSLDDIPHVNVYRKLSESFTLQPSKRLPGDWQNFQTGYSGTSIVMRGEFQIKLKDRLATENWMVSWFVFPFCWHEPEPFVQEQNAVGNKVRRLAWLRDTLGLM